MRTVLTGGARLLLFLFALCSAPGAALAFSCTMSVTTVNFGSIDVTTGQPATSSGTMTMNCNGVPNNKPVLFCVSISGGTASDATSRFLTSSGGGQLRYQLYSDAALTNPWGSYVPSLYGGGYQWVVTGTTANGTFTTPVYGQILGSQNTVPQGVYTSTLLASATFDGNATGPCPDPKNQGTTTASFSAAASVTVTCSVGASNLNFGNIGLLTSNVDMTSTITAQCANGTPYNIGLDPGTGPGATVAVRKMIQGTNTLNYTLYSNPARSTVWGNTIGTNTVTGTGTGTVQSYTVYGRIPPQSIQGPGAYSDTIVVTLTF